MFLRAVFCAAREYACHLCRNSGRSALVSPNFYKAAKT